ncbi:MAG: pentapeptide repeat-containing protein [Candidatus Scalindua sp.]|jgi:BTB/POZ domain-containing protein KCTD9|nr:pentapeptide repeat-containing protein [Candidatus Scalindua sp.]MBT6226273.1 pentapeptide repeat-containing protein [Candidatus Scalindua sp.]
MENVLVEAHGMLFDILVIGVLILFLNKLVEKRIENRRYIEEIDDFRRWESEEAAYRNAGNLKRLKRNGYKGKIDLRDCYLGYVDLQKDGLLEFFSKYLAGINLSGADLNEAILYGANLIKTNLTGANLENAKLDDADLCNAKLDLANLEKASLKGVFLIDADLRNAVLIETNLHSANLNKANLQGADLGKSDLGNANLERVKHLTIEQLSKVKTLYQADLDEGLMDQAIEKYPHLLDEPVG